MNSQVKELLCPRDGSRLEVRRWGESEYGFCVRCHGIRIERDQLAGMVRNADEPPLSYPADLAGGPEIVEGTALCSCSGQPVMDGVVHGDLSLDACPACGAVWFDAGEIQCYLAERRKQAPASLGDARNTTEVLAEVGRESFAGGTGPLLLDDFFDAYFD